MIVAADAVGTPPETTADVVYGQLDSFETATLNKGGISGRPTSESLWVPGGVALDRAGNLYVADTTNNRVLFFLAGSSVATRVYGQNGNFTTNVSNFGSGPGRPTTENGLSGPEGVALDSSGNLYVADRGGNRVLFYPAGSTTATRSYGQRGSLTSNAINHNDPLLQPAADSLWAPFGLALDQNDNLYIADAGNHRVVFYPRDATTATRVYGQPDFSTHSVVSPPTADSLNAPWGVAVDRVGNLLVADRNNSRVLFYASGSTTATGVYGQAGIFTTRNAGTTAASLSAPEGVALDRYDNLYVADRGNNRVLFFPAGSTTAAQLYGQAGFSVNDGVPNRGRGAPSDVTLSAPKGVGLDRLGNLYVADRNNNRVLEFYRTPDTLAPTASPTPSVAANASGWNNTDVTVTWNWADEVGGTGIDDANCEVSTTSSAEGTALTLGATCQDLAGNVATASYSLKIDRTPPVASAGQTPPANAAGWNDTDVTVAWNWSDAAGGAGLDVGTCAISSTSSGEGNPVVVSATCSDLAGNSGSEFHSVRVDKTPPSVALVGGPASGQTYNRGSVPAAPTCSAADALSGLSGPCAISGYGAEAGTHTVTATAADNAGNRNGASVTYSVVAAGWTVAGFYAPIDMGDVWNLLKAGSTAPLKFEVFAGATELTDTGIVAQLRASETSCTSGQSDDIELLATGGTSLRYDTTAGQFVYNWQTPRKPGSCYVVSVTMSDGSTLLAKFRLK